MVLPRFVIPDEQQVIVPEATMRAAVEAMFVSIGMPAEAAAETTDVLVVSDLRGNDSHGVSNMLRMCESTPGPRAPCTHVGCIPCSRAFEM